jgi:hypothetical protein
MTNFNKKLINYFPFLLLLWGSQLFSQTVPYNKNYQIACHNCYDPKYAENIEDVFSFTTAIEIDIWDNFQGSGILSAGNKMHGDWYVKHDPRHKGNLNCCGGSFGDCLRRIKAWSDKNPKHNVMTIFIDKKENWSDRDETRKPTDLDRLIVSILSKEAIFSPSNLIGDKANLKEATGSYWPSMDALKGKFIFVITDGTEITIRKPLNEYIEAQKNKAVCFVAPQISAENEINSLTGFTLENARNVVFYNLKYPSDLSKNISSINCLSRIFGSPETVESYHDLINKTVNFIAIDNYKLLKLKK